VEKRENGRPGGLLSNMTTAELRGMKLLARGKDVVIASELEKRKVSDKSDIGRRSQGGRPLTDRAEALYYDRRRSLRADRLDGGLPLPLMRASSMPLGDPYEGRLLYSGRNFQTKLNTCSRVSSFQRAIDFSVGHRAQLTTAV